MATFGFSVDEVRMQVRLDAPSISATWSWNDAGQIVTTSLRQPDGSEWIDPAFPSQLYRPPIGEDGFNPPAPILGPTHRDLAPPNTTILEDGRAHLAWTLTPVENPLQVTWHIEAFPAHPVIRQWIELTNTSPAVQLVERLPVFHGVFGGEPRSLTAHHGLERRGYLQRGEWPDWFTWSSEPLRTGQAARITSGYRKEATWLALTSLGDGPGLVFGWESNAEATCHYGDVNGDGSLVVSCALSPEYQLQPGATLTGPAGFILLAEGDLDELSYRCHQFVEDVLSWKADESRFPHVVFNSWGYGADIDESSIEFCLEICQKVGVEHFVVDFGWEDPDWHPLPDKFPNGLAPIADRVHAAGMLFGIHLSFGNLSSLSQAYRDHPDWGNGPGQWAYHREGQVHGLTLGNPATRDWLVDTLVRVADECKIDHFLTDHYLWGPVNTPTQELHATDDYQTIAEGFDQVLARFHALRPHVMIEHCDNGIGFPTFKMVQQHTTSIGVDALSSLKERVQTWRSSYVLHPRFLDNYVCDHDRNFKFIGEGLTDWDYRSHMFGGPLILMTSIKTLKEGSQDWAALTRGIDLFKRVRHRILTGKVLHLLEPQPMEQIGRGWDGWDAIGSYDPARDRAIVFAFRLGGTVDRRSIPFHGLREGSTYRVSNEDDSRVFSVTGKELMEQGLDWELPGNSDPRLPDPNGMVRGSAVIYLDAVSEG
jgi:alpha-galactosidase